VITVDTDMKIRLTTKEIKYIFMVCLQSKCRIKIIKPFLLEGLL